MDRGRDGWVGEGFAMAGRMTGRMTTWRMVRMIMPLWWTSGS